MDLSLDNHTALVCGASQGIGAATAHELSLLGARVILLARNADKLKSIHSSLKPHPKGHEIIVCDIGLRDELTNKVAAKLSQTGGATILVNNTGGPAGGPIASASDEQFLESFEKHVLASSRLAQLLLPYMKQQRYGRIVNIISTSVKIPIPGLGVSNTIRGAVASWAKTLAGEVAVDGITVNCVLPGMTKTDRLEAIVQNTVQKTNQTRDSVEAGMIATIPARRFAEAHEVAAAVAFLTSPAASYINGVALAVDGGRTGCY